MSAQDYLIKKIETSPIVYAYSDTRFPGMLKVGYTSRTIDERMKEHYPTVVPYKSWKVEMIRSAMRSDGSSFDDHAVHRVLENSGIPKVVVADAEDGKRKKGEWFRCGVREVEKAVQAVKLYNDTIIERTRDFEMRPEQRRAVDVTSGYYKAFATDFQNRGRIPHFLWNAKMRFGKTFTAYQLALRMGWRKVLVLTFKPAVKTAWKEDLLTHIDFEGWQFCEKGENREFNTVDEKRPFVCFASFQDVLGRDKAGGYKATNELLQTIQWDCIILDEYHYGAWGKNAKEYYDSSDVLMAAEEAVSIYSEDSSKKEIDALENYDEQLMPLTTGAYLYLSGTPFRAIQNGEFIEDQIFNWTYSDEQAAKVAWEGDDNPYLSLPQMVMMTYQLPDRICEIAAEGEFDEFDLNEFFRADDNGFVHQDYVQKWISWIRGNFSETVVTELKQQSEKPALPFSDYRLLRYLQHTFWFMPSVASCKAMGKLLRSKANSFFDDYKIIVAAGNDAGMGAEAVQPVYDAMGNPQKSKTITLSCGKLSTGVTVRPWSGIFMLRNSQSPETYFQAAFRVQSPWTIKDEHGKEIVLKPLCYVFDFAPDRALRQVAEYSGKLDVRDVNQEVKVAEFIKFLPVLAYDGSSMKAIDASGILDMAMSGTTATLLARKWESALLVNVDNLTLQRLLNNAEAMQALMNIEGFRSLNSDIETIVNKSEHVKKLKREKGDDITPTEKRELTAEEKEYKSKRKQIQEKLIKFATRIPVFMYLTDFRENALRDVITQLEPELFRKVTGLTIRDFELLVSLGVFNSQQMNDAVYKFRRYEDSSLEYTGIDKRDPGKTGAWDTVIYDSY